MSKALVFLLDNLAYQLVQAFPVVPLDENRTPAHLYGRKGRETVIQGCRFNGGRNLRLNVFTGLGVVTQFDYDNSCDLLRRFALTHVRQWQEVGSQRQWIEVELGNDGLAVSISVGEKEGRNTLAVPGVFSHYFLVDEYHLQGVLTNCAVYPTPDSRFEYVPDEKTGNLRLQSDVIAGSLGDWREYFPDEIQSEDGEFALPGVSLPASLGGTEVQETIIKQAGVPSSFLLDRKGGRRVAA